MMTAAGQHSKLGVMVVMVVAVQILLFITVELGKVTVMMMMNVKMA